MCEAFLPPLQGLSWTESCSSGSPIRKYSPYSDAPVRIEAVSPRRRVMASEVSSAPPRRIVASEPPIRIVAPEVRAISPRRRVVMEEPAIRVLTEESSPRSVVTVEEPIVKVVKCLCFTAALDSKHQRPAQHERASKTHMHIHTHVRVRACTHTSPTANKSQTATFAPVRAIKGHGHNPGGLGHARVTCNLKDSSEGGAQPHRLQPQGPTHGLRDSVWSSGPIQPT